MKKYVIRVVCLAAAFLLLCSAALADEIVTLDKYGICFTVPEGMEWISTEDADGYADGLKAQLEEIYASGFIAVSPSSELLIRASAGKVYEAYSFASQKNDQIISNIYSLFEASGDGDSIKSVDVYDAGAAKWAKVKYSMDAITNSTYITVQGKTFVSVYPYSVSEDEATVILDSFTFKDAKKKTFISRFIEYMRALISRELGISAAWVALSLACGCVSGLLYGLFSIIKKIFVRKK